MHRSWEAAHTAHASLEGTAGALTWRYVKLLEGFVQNLCLIPLFWLFLFIILFGCFHVCVVPCVSGDCGGQKNVLDSLELELLTVVSHYEGAENCTSVHFESNKWS